MTQLSGEECLPQGLAERPTPSSFTPITRSPPGVRSTPTVMCPSGRVCLIALAIKLLITRSMRPRSISIAAASIHSAISRHSAR